MTVWLLKFLKLTKNGSFQRGWTKTNVSSVVSIKSWIMSVDARKSSTAVLNARAKISIIIEIDATLPKRRKWNNKYPSIFPTPREEVSAGYPIWETLALWTVVSNACPIPFHLHSILSPKNSSPKSTRITQSELKESSQLSMPRWFKPYGVWIVTHTLLMFWKMQSLTSSQCSVDITSMIPNNCCPSCLMVFMKIWIEFSISLTSKI